MSIREGGTNCEVELVSCSLSDLSSCSCSNDCHTAETAGGSSSRRKRVSRCRLGPEELLSLSAKQFLLTAKPTLIDHLIDRNKSALMGPKKVGRGGASGGSNVGKRKRVEEPTSAGQGKGSAKSDPPVKKRKPGRIPNSEPEPKKGMSGGRITTTRSGGKVRIPFSLRSGRKIAEILKKRRLCSKKDSNSTHPKSTAEPVVHPGPPPSNGSAEPARVRKKPGPKPGQQRQIRLNENGEEVRKKKKKRKRCSMWVKKYKKVKKDSRTDELPKTDEMTINKVEIVEKEIKHEPEVPDKEPEKSKVEPEEVVPVPIVEESTPQNPTIEVDIEDAVKVDQVVDKLIPEVLEDVTVVPQIEDDPVKSEVTENGVPDVDSPQELTQVPEPNKGPSAEIEPTLELTVTEDTKRDADSTTICDDASKSLDDSHSDFSYLHDEDVDTEQKKESELPDSTIAATEKPTDSTEPVDDPQTADIPESVAKEELSLEQRQMKESVLQALGLKSLSSQPSDDKPVKKDGYTGTLKAVIKLNRSGDKKHSMVYKRSHNNGLSMSDKLEYRICSEIPPGEGLTDMNGEKKTPKLTEPPSENNGVVSSVAEDDDGKAASGKESNLVIPEKSSSFSIHPGRLCSDVCSYCFGKFGSLDTPCHVAQLKGEERQKKILENEPHLTGESCLCDACYRYVDRKANCPDKFKMNSGNRLKPPSQSSVCCVTRCGEPATRTIKRKWLVKLKKSITNKLDIDIDKPGHGVYYPLCTEHHYWVEYYTVCGICRKRLSRNNLFSLGREADRLNLMLAEDGIPARLSDNLFLCKLCRYYSDLRLKYPDVQAIPAAQQQFYKNYRRKILVSLDVAVSDSDDEMLERADEEESQENPSKKGDSDPNGKQGDDVMAFRGLATLLGDQPQQQARIQVKFGNVNIGTLSNLNIGQQSGTPSSSSASSPSGGSGLNGKQEDQPRPGSPNDINLKAQLECEGPNTPDGSWERYQSTIQFDMRTKKLWTELQRPYGNQSSFLRHLVMLESIWRNNHLVLTPDADERSVRYITSARNRIRSLESKPVERTLAQTTSAATTPWTTGNMTVTATTVTTVATPIIKTPQLTITATSSPKNFPIITNSREIEVTPIRGKTDPPRSQPKERDIVLSQKPPWQVHSQQQRAVNQQMYMQYERKLTPLDRAKSLVRMAPAYNQLHPGRHMRGMLPPPRCVMPHQFQSGSRVPPLLRLPQSAPGYFVPVQPPQPNIQPTHQQQIRGNRPLFPKLPKNLTVMPMPKSASSPQAITLSHAGITIEKQVAPIRGPTYTVEKPSISVFREPSTP